MLEWLFVGVEVRCWKLFLRSEMSVCLVLEAQKILYSQDDNDSVVLLLRGTVS